ncbi:MAG TPA: trypsin-like peptidase domain-containing protein [Pirellulaceae bacterium]|nr:trypsin-like peptidase domain-containing protein [Pirellulaceae bacterium]
MRKCLLLCLGSAVLGALISWCLFQGPANDANLFAQAPLGRPAPQRFPPVVHVSSDYDESIAELTPEERTNVMVYEQVNRSVVNITTKAVKDNVLLFLDAEFEGSGSGSVLDQDGHILTNHHVVLDAKEIKVTLYNGENYDATLVGFDAVNDIAVVRVQAPRELLVPVTPGDSRRLHVGQHIYAIGNPFGLERTLTVGIISSLNRSLPSRSGRTMKSIIQIDAALNRGNSGGPLLDSHGRLVGMNTAIASSTGENTGVGFSIPINTILRIVPQLIQTGRVIHPDLGITRVHQNDGKLVVATLAPGGPAERAGIRGFRLVKQQKRRGPFTVEEKSIDRKSADTILAVDGERVKTADDLLSQVEMKRPGEVVQLTVLRDEREVVVAVTLAAAE